MTTKYCISMGVGSGGQGVRVPFWIFTHGSNIVDRGINVIFFGLFLLFFDLFYYFFGLYFLCPPLQERRKYCYFSVFFFANFRFFFVAPPPFLENFLPTLLCISFAYSDVQFFYVNILHVLARLFVKVPRPGDN